LENVRKNYREQKRIFDEAILYEDNDDDNNEIGPDDIDSLIDNLFKLELNGKTLKSIVNNINSKKGPPQSKQAASIVGSFSANHTTNRKRSPPTTVRTSNNLEPISKTKPIWNFLSSKQKQRDESDVSETDAD
jgi:hypothetical protein